MRRSLKIENEFYLNMDNIVSFNLEDNVIQITTNSADTNYFEIFIGEQRPFTGSRYVTESDFRRIKREICEYMGVLDI